MVTNIWQYLLFCIELMLDKIVSVHSLPCKCRRQNRDCLVLNCLFKGLVTSRTVIWVIFLITPFTLLILITHILPNLLTLTLALGMLKSLIWYFSWEAYLNSPYYAVSWVAMVIWSSCLYHCHEYPCHNHFCKLDCICHNLRNFIYRPIYLFPIMSPFLGLFSTALMDLHGWCCFQIHSLYLPS